VKIVKNLEDLYLEMLGNPTRGNLAELDRNYSQKIQALSNKKDQDKVDISQIQKNGELQNAYLYLKTQWAIKEQRTSGLITNQNLPNYQRNKRNLGKKTSTSVDKIQKLNKELRKTARAGLILVSILSIYQLINYFIIQEKVIASTDIYNSSEAWNNLIIEEDKLRSEAKKSRDRLPDNLKALPNKMEPKEADSDIISSAKNCNISQMKYSYSITKNLNVKNSLGETPAHWMSRLNCHEGLKWAISNGADISIKDNSGRTAEEWARLNNSYESIQVMNKKIKK
jgi:hypothetical protein